MNDSDKSALYLVPYAPEKKKIEYFNTFFLSRKRMYLLFSAFFTAFFFFGYSLAKRYMLTSIETYIVYFDKWLPVMMLFAYISSYTIFSAVFAYFMFSYISAYLAFVFAYSGFAAVLPITIIILFSFIYFTELKLCCERAKFGIKQIFKPKSIISFSVMTIVFLLSTLLIFRMI